MKQLHCQPVRNYYETTGVTYKKPMRFDGILLVYFFLDLTKAKNEHLRNCVNLILRKSGRPARLMTGKRRFSARTVLSKQALGNRITL